VCGIAGIVAPDARRHEGAVERMVSALAHRGPDGHGTWIRDGCALGHARLSIVDLATGAQPMEDARGDRAITFNGEIYGFREIRAGLEREGRAFRTTSDTEVILALHERRGEDLLGVLPGMFAFALWDGRTRTLLAARDRFGEKPFFWARGRGGELVFASEIGAVLASGLVAPVLSKRAVARYLERLHTGPAATIWENVHSLPPAHRLVFEAATGGLRVERYWSLPPPGPPMALDEAAERFRALLDRAVARQLVADVPVGAFLSGGLDSTTVVALAARHDPGLATVSFGFGGERDELPFARDAARTYGVRSLEVAEVQVDVGRRLEELAEVYDEPFADSSAIPTYEICRAGRRHWKVALTGDGGDELLGGYSFWYQPLWHAARGGAPGAEAWWRATKRVARALHLRRAAARARERATGLALRRRHGSVRAAHDAQLRFVSRETLRALGLPDPEPFPLPEATGGLDDAFRADLLDYMPGDILVKVDRAAMAHGLELRAPFLDVDVASFLVALPSDLKVDGRSAKILLRRAFHRDWPPSVRARPKQGFAAPVGEWLARPDVEPLLARTLGDRASALHALLPFDATRPLAARRDQTTWSLLVLGLWLEKSA
jgi:asparagine synthase (glutamine-hydrolysing)